MHPKMNRKGSGNGTERERKGTGKGQERERVRIENVSVTALYANQSKQASPAKKAVRKVIRPRQKKTGFCRRSDAKNRLFGQKIAFFLHNFDKKSKNICIIAEIFVTLWSRFYGVRLHACTRTYNEKTVSKSITNRDTGRLETTRITKKPKNK